MIRSALIFLFLVIALPILSQVRVSSSVDRRDIRIGEAVTLTLSAAYPSATPTNWFSIPETFNNLEVIRKEKIDTSISNNSITLTQKILLTGFDSGRWEIPSFSIVTGGRDYNSDSFSITVSALTLEGKDYKDIKEIEDVNEKKTEQYWWWMATAAILLMILLITWWLIKKKKKGPAPVPRSSIGAYEAAMKQLQELKQSNLVDKGEISTYYTKLSDIFRNYLQRDKGIRSLEKTSLELLSELKQRMPGDDITSISIALRRCDFVKFAKYIPSNNEHTEAVSMIEQTIKILHQQP